jgi:hypothetical protein
MPPTASPAGRRPGLRCARARALLPLAVAACQPPGAGTPTTRPAPPPHTYLLTDLVGGWRWQLRTSEAGTTRIETETWRLRPAAGVPSQLAGRYVRSVEVRSDDRVPFACNQRPWYRQRATYDVTVEATATSFAVRETDYQTEPSPCDHGFRHLGAYRAELLGNRLALHWDSGDQTLWQTDAELADLPASPWPASPDITGPWRWDATSYDDAGNVRDESEWWELTRRTEQRIDATYRRRVTVRSPDGAPIACAGAPAWTFDDAFVLDGQREEEHWHFYERAADPAEHPCLQSTPRRNLDEATAAQIGDYLVLEWRGKRHQVLYRPDS